MEEIRKGGVSVEDYIRLINECFGMEEPEAGFPHLLPKLFAPGRHPENDTLFLMKEGCPVACVGTFPLTFSLGGKKLKAVGIGNVATRADRRGEGCMQRLMGEALRRMAKEDVDLAVLGGRRHRYNHFDFEKCDAMRYFALTRKTVSDSGLFGQSTYTPLPDPVFRPLLREENDLLDQLWEAMHQRPYHTVRPRADLYDILISWRSVPYVFLRGEKLAGWAIHYVSKGQLSEFHAIDPADTPCFLKKAVETLGDLNVALPPHRPAFSAAADRLCEHPMLISNECFRILNWQKVLSALLAVKASYTPMGDGAFSLMIRGIKGDIILTLRVAGGVCSVEEDPEATPALTLSTKEAERFFFANYAPEREGLAPFLAPLLPLPLTIDEADNV